MALHLTFSQNSHLMISVGYGQKGLEKRAKLSKMSLTLKLGKSAIYE